jgi:c(7)-type cytochrome triheme protein
MKHRHVFSIVLASILYAVPAMAELSGKDVYVKTCGLCHATGLAGAPKYGNAADWGPRLASGVARLYISALKGTPRGMPGKGGNLSYSDAEVKAAVDYMVAAIKVAAKPATATPQKPAPKEDAKPEPKAVAAVPPEKAAAKQAGVAAESAPAGDVNAFNRLLKSPGKRNPPPTEDGIHDPANDGTSALLPPLTAYAGLPKSLAGNRVNWVDAIEKKKITPRWDRADPKAEPVVMDLNIVREVKGSMPDVVYPHKQHTEWLDCSNCHPAIFVPQKGANSISMASILLGEKCGVCHGKVAFPVSECRLCHSRKKDLARSAQAAAGAAK